MTPWTLIVLLVAAALQPPAPNAAAPPSTIVVFETGKGTIEIAVDPDRIVDVSPERLAAFISIEQGRKDLQRQRSGDE